MAALHETAPRSAHTANDGFLVSEGGCEGGIRLLYKISDTVPKVTLDWSKPGFGRGFAVNVLFRFMNESHYMFVYWILGTFFDDIETLTLAVGLMRSFKSVGSAMSFGIGAVKVKPMVNLIVAFVMFSITIPSTFSVVWLVPERPVDARKEFSDDESLETDKGNLAVIATAADPANI